MAKLIWVCSRKTLSATVKNKIFKICKKISPDNIVTSEPKVIVGGNIAYGIMNPTNSLLISGNSLVMGIIIGNDDNWHIPQQGFPEGSYAMFRDGVDNCEIVSDAVASRTIWYYKNDEIFVASTSQRAIILFIGGFEFNTKVIPWMISSGNLGPSNSWDKRINLLPPDSSVILNKANWSISTKSNPIEFNEFKASDRVHEKKLRDTLIYTFKSIKLNYSDWILPLSGGYDSRGILCLLYNLNNNAEGLKSVTWGLKSSLNIKKNDAHIAKKLANKYNLSHKYFHTDLSEEPIEKIINRFLLNGEGRIDELSGYMDGFKIWKILFEQGIQGLIRGDEGFGCRHYSSPAIARMNQNCALFSDFLNLKDFQRYGLPYQELPQNLKQKEGETISAYRDRLFHEHALPTAFSALSDLKLSYVEVINPLLSRSILEQVRQLPDHLRTDKSLFKKIVKDLSPHIDFATSGANAPPSKILRQNQFVSLLKNELSSNDAKTLFSGKFLDFIINGIKTEGQITDSKVNLFSLWTIIRKIIPRFIKSRIQNKYSIQIVDPNILAFRVFLIIRMNKIFKDESFLDSV